MIQHLPEYRTPTSRVSAGRILKIQGERILVSTCPWGKPASRAAGYPIIPIPVGEKFLAGIRPQPGDWVVVDNAGIGVLTEAEFTHRHTLVRDPAEGGFFRPGDEDPRMPGEVRQTRRAA